MERIFAFGLLAFLLHQDGTVLSSSFWHAGDKSPKLYTNDWCPACVRTDALLQELGVKAERVNMDYALEADQIRAKYGDASLPILVLGDKVIHGYAPDRIRQALQKRQ
ncbi:glutaredoxin family protein [Gallaecimonas kandeliae]|uniref:glutaredoxin family protein n=1 Tax=Gallaecimonas kandeliae TaxID=3029055 RepID=UPI002647E1D7|nr:glutaredoxin family protein [Gallaecimonas kandeliae]WKE65026.1 glutaredoxin family protein [Gallaecimonas kandeliae]